MQTEAIDILDTRYIYLEDLVETDQLIYKAKLYGRYANQENFQDHLVADAFDENMTLEYNLTNIFTWDDVVRYMELYFNKAVAWTPFYTGPYNNETTYILCELLQITSLNIIPIDSQPGFYIDNYDDTEKMIQKPYIGLAGPESIMDMVIAEAKEYIIDKSYEIPLSLVIKNNNYIIDNHTDLLYTHFINLELVEDIITIFFGVRTPEDRMQMDYTLDYIFSNKFFIDVINIIRKITY